jgi:hypothetical protein
VQNWNTLMKAFMKEFYLSVRNMVPTLTSR